MFAIFVIATGGITACIAAADVTSRAGVPGTLPAALRGSGVITAYVVTAVFTRLTATTVTADFVRVAATHYAVSFTVALLA